MHQNFTQPHQQEPQSTEQIISTELEINITTSNDDHSFIMMKMEVQKSKSYNLYKLKVLIHTLYQSLGLGAKKGKEN